MIELRERDLGQLIGQIFEVAADQFGRLFLLQLLLSAPGLIAQLVLLPGFDLEGLQVGAPPEELLPVVLAFYGKLGVVLLITAVTWPFELAAVSLLVKRLVDGQPPDLGACLRGALRLWPRCLLLSVTLGIVTSFGMMCCIVPGVVFWTWFFVAAPVLVVEDAPWASAFGRSRQLVGGLDRERNGRFWEVLAVYVLTGFAPGFVLAPIFMLLGLVPSVMVQTIAQHVLAITVGVIPLVAMPLVYYHLRVVREAHDLARVADLVDRIGAAAPDPDAPPAA